MSHTTSTQSITPQSSEAFRPEGHACDAACRFAKCPPGSCVCSCGGAQHGVALLPLDLQPGAVKFKARAARVGGVFATLPATPSDDIWGAA